MCSRRIWCYSNDMLIFGDGRNCPNNFNAATGEYLVGCCDNILIDVDIYLEEFAISEFGNANCNSLSGTETPVCNYMVEKTNTLSLGMGILLSLGGFGNGSRCNCSLLKNYSFRKILTIINLFASM